MKLMQFSSCGVLFRHRILTPLKFALAMMIAATIFPGINASAQTAYWDTNGSTPGSSSGTTAPGQWDGSTDNWSTSSDGTVATQIWNPGDIAVISAGTNATGAYTITVSGTQAPGSIAFNLGDVTLDDGALQTSSVSALGGASGHIASDLIGSGGLTKSGAGTVTLSGTASYTGDTTINGGTLVVDGASGAIRATTIVKVGDSSSGTLSVTDSGEITTGSFIELGHDPGVSGTLNVSGTGSQVTSGYYLDVGFDGTGDLNITDGGHVTVAGFARFGVNATGIGTGLVSGTGSQLNVGAQLELGTYGNGSLTIADGGTVTTQSLRFNRLGPGHSTLNLNDGGTLVIAFSNDGIRKYTGPPANTMMNFAGGTLKAAGNSWSTTVAATLTNTTIVDTNGLGITLGGALTGSGGLTKIGAGNLTLSADNLYAGTTTISGGTLRVGDGGTTGSIASSSIVNNANLTINRSDAYALSANISGVGNLTKQGAGALTLSGTNTFDQMAIDGGSLVLPSGGKSQFGGGNSLTSSNGGSLALSGGTFQLGGADFSMFVPATLTGNTTFDTNSFNGGIYGPLSGAGGFTKIGAGILTVTNNNTFGGPVTVDGGTLLVNTAPDLGTGNGDVTVNAGAALAAATNLEFARQVTVTGSDAIVTSAVHLEVGSAGNGGMTISDGGIVAAGTTVTLAYYGSDTGTVDVTDLNSTLYAQTALRVAFGGTGTLTLADGGIANAQNLILASQLDSIGILNLNTGGTLQVGGADGITVGDGTGTFNLAGGTIKVGGDYRVVGPPPSNTIDLTDLPNIIRNVIAANTPQPGDTGLTTGVAMQLSNTSTIDTNGSAATLSGLLSGSGSLTKSGAGTLTLSGSNTYSGGTQITGGTLQAAFDDAVGTGTIAVDGGIFLVDEGVTLSPPNTVTLSGGDYHRNFGDGADLAHGVDATSQFAGGANDTTAEILQGTLAISDTIQTSFADSSGALNDAIRLSDVYSFQGTATGTDIFVLQLSMTGVSAGSYLGWLNGSNQWVNAVEGNTSGTATFVAGAYNSGTDFHLGYYGVDTLTGSVWAVLDHNSDYSIVPEPSTLALLALAGLAFLRRRRE